MPLLINTFPVSIDLFCHVNLLNDKRLAVILIHIDQSNTTGHLLQAWSGFKQRIFFWYHQIWKNPHAPNDFLMRIFYQRFAAVFFIQSFCSYNFLVSNLAMLVRFILLHLKCPINIFVEFAWNWSSVITGYNDEQLFHFCA